jgi:isoleucyl-tRNA synthetase
MLYGGPAYRNVICLGHIVDESGAKMSKSKGNVVEPLPLFDRYGADSVRWYMFMASEPGDQKRFSERLVAEAQRGYVNTLWNVYSFFVLYANLDRPDLEHAPAFGERPEIDRWLLARLEETVRDVTASLDAYDARGGGRALERFVDDLSNWYVRRNRSRFWGEGGQVDVAAYATLHEALVTVSQLTAPFTPFLADAMYRNLTRGTGAVSVHLTRWPEVREERLDARLTSEMAAVIKVVELGRAVRGAHNLKTRQPLASVSVRASTPEATGALRRFRAQLLEELNVKDVTFLAGDTDLVRYSLRPNLPVIGKVYGKALPTVRAALERADAAAVARAVGAGQPFTVEANGQTFTLTGDQVLVDAKAPEGVAAAEDAGFLVAFDTALTRDLVLEGLARDLVRGIQEARKAAGFEVQDRIRLALDLAGDAREAASVWRDFIAGEVLASELSFGAGEGFSAEVEGGKAYLTRV